MPRLSTSTTRMRRRFRYRCGGTHIPRLRPSTFAALLRGTLRRGRLVRGSALAASTVMHKPQPRTPTRRRRCWRNWLRQQTAKMIAGAGATIQPGRGVSSVVPKPSGQDGVLESAPPGSSIATQGSADLVQTPSDCGTVYRPSARQRSALAKPSHRIAGRALHTSGYPSPQASSTFSSLTRLTGKWTLDIWGSGPRRRAKS